MPKIDDMLKDAKAGTLTIAECIQALNDSEGVKANSVWKAEGHALQHSNQDTSGVGRRLDDEFHYRGPLPIEKQLKGGPNAGMYKAAITVEPTGGFTPKSNTFHSQFKDDQQAGMCLMMALRSKGGIWALELLKNSPRLSVTVALGMPGGTEMIEREAQLVGAGTPTSNIIPPADMQSTRNFVWLKRRDMSSVVAVLRSKDSPLGHLHVQSFYPCVDPLGAGNSTAEVKANSPADYAGPANVAFH